jgi:EAL domain-containing protein (putative c-di-GMP-specific phosphodiesterase class I)
LGYRIAVDDLGAGYAGLNYLAMLEPDVVKLDIGLVRDIHKIPVKRKLVGSMIGLCRDLGIVVVAEGVETVEERDVLVELQCDLLQGFLFARPGKPFPEPVWDGAL